MSSSPPVDQHSEPITPVRVGLWELARYFTRLGFTAFGGPAAHIAIMEDDLVTRRRWVSRPYFLDTLATTQLVPGPNSTELAIHIGYIQRGVAGLFIAGTCFILPAFLIVLALSIGYVAYGTLPAVQGLLYGIQPVIVAIVALAAYRLGQTACRTTATIVLACVAAALTLLIGIDPLWVILGGGIIGILLLGLRRTSVASLLAFYPDQTRLTRAIRSLASGLSAAPPWALQAASEPQLWRLGLFFLKVGATLMGSGYVLISYLENDLVRGTGWLTHQQLVDAIAVGQLTPGPVFSTAAFVGYVVMAGTDANVPAGVVGAIVCALAIFLPSFFIVWAMAPWIDRLRHWQLARAFLDGINAAVVGSIAATTVTLFLAATVNLEHPIYQIPIGTAELDLPAAAMAVGATSLLLGFRYVNSTWLIPIGALLGLALTAITR